MYVHISSCNTSKPLSHVLRRDVEYLLMESAINGIVALVILANKSIVQVSPLPTNSVKVTNSGHGFPLKIFGFSKTFDHNQGI